MSEKLFTQDELNGIVQKRIAEQEKKHEAYVTTLKTEYETKYSILEEQKNQLDVKVKEYEPLNDQFNQTKEQLQRLESEKQEIELRSEISKNGIKPERIDAFAKMLGNEKTPEAISKLKEQFPEWVATEETKQPPRFAINGVANFGVQTDGKNKKLTEIKNLTEFLMNKD